MLITDITMKEFKEGLKKTKTLIVPFGTVEAHGTHMPLSTDTIIMEEVCKATLKKKKFFLAPPIHYGVSTGTGQHPGSINISCETLRRIVFDIVRDSYEKGLRNFILVSGHGGGQHMAALKEASEILTKELKDVRIAPLTIYEILPKEAYAIAETKNDSHAGELETSLMLYINEKLVKGRDKEQYPKLPKPIVVKDKMKYWPGAVWGNPKKASEKKGQEFFDYMVQALLKLIKDINKKTL